MHLIVPRNGWVNLAEVFNMWDCCGFDAHDGMERASVEVFAVRGSIAVPLLSGGLRIHDILSPYGWITAPPIIDRVGRSTTFLLNLTHKQVVRRIKTREKCKRWAGEGGLKSS